MCKNKNDKRNFLLKKKMLLMYISSCTLLTSNGNVNANQLNAPVSGIIKEMTENYSTTNSQENNLRSGVTKEIYDNISVKYLNEKNNLKATVSTNKVKEVTKAQYYEYPCSDELKEHIQIISEQYNVPEEIMMTIIDQESGGKWDTNGVISPTNDYGLTQINKCNEEFIKENLGYTMNDILNDPFIAVEAQALLLNNIMKEYGYDVNNIDYENVFGTYNGWVLWRQKEMALEYAESCMKIYEEKFGSNSKKLN